MSDEVVSKLTYYNGYIFRSLLEAKWAILFDYLKIQYQYESQRFDTKYGWYLPDFHLKNVNLWIEIKPKFPSSEAIDKIQTVADQTNCFACILISFPEIDLFGKEWQPTQSFVFLFSPGSKKSAHISINQIYNFIFNSPINKNQYFMGSCLTTAI
ncbi:hypothetical protein [Planktothrix pseudagardhii]|nr:hypothetical protein [Planktothrix pseudagardhii]CAD5963030.1 hypothetical protein NO713_03324 [Planktothrix pseudagardhii]